MRGLFLALALLASPALAVEPGEELKDPAQEARARVLSQELRCVVCRNQSIDDSDAGLARDLRLLLRERIAAGDDDREALNYIEARYGEYVFLRPRFDGRNAVLWLGGPALLLLGAAAAFGVMRRGRRAEAAPPPLTAAEQARLDAIVEAQDRGA